MSSVFSQGQGRKQRRGTESAIGGQADFSSRCLAHFQGINEECCLNSCGVAQGHFQERVEAGIGKPV
jgi:hypothetical protein